MSHPIDTHRWRGDERLGETPKNRNTSNKQILTRPFGPDEWLKNPIKQASTGPVTAFPLRTQSRPTDIEPKKSQSQLTRVSSGQNTPKHL
jgi:hypothetical protein